MGKRTRQKSKQKTEGNNKQQSQQQVVSPAEPSRVQTLIPLFTLEDAKEEARIIFSYLRDMIFTVLRSVASFFAKQIPLIPLPTLEGAKEAATLLLSKEAAIILLSFLGDIIFTMPRFVASFFAKEKLIPLLTLEDANEMARILLSPTRVHGVSSNLRTESDLSSYLRDIFTVTESAASFFAVDLIKALVDEESDHINKQIPSSNVGDKQSLLAICCQWKQIQKTVGWKGKSEMVKIILAHPKIRVNDVMPNGCNAAFMCVKYADLDTLNSIIGAGCNLSQKDKYGQTLLSNTVEYPNPDILRTVLNHVSPHEVFKKTFKPNDVERIPFSAADLIVTQYASPPISWKILGHPPPIEDTAECLVMLRQLGVKFTYHPKMFQWVALAACFDSIEGCKSRGMVNAEDFKKLGECILGLWFPPVIQKIIESSEDCRDKFTPDDDDVSCAVCLKELMEERVKLYCGHSFCLDCIVELGKHCTQCPLCRRKLCLDVAHDRDLRLENEIDERHVRRIDVGPLQEDSWFVMNAVTMEGVENLSGTQVLEEARELGISSTSSSSVQMRQKLKSEISKGHNIFVAMATGKGSMKITKSFGSTVRKGEQVEVGGMILETSATRSMANQQQSIVSPHYGPVCVEITIKGIPVLASISNNSKYTMVSPKFRETFRLKQIPNLTTNRMRCALTNGKVRRSICLEEFSLAIGDAVVKLRNVIECETSLIQGIQLGRDFFESARYCSMSIKMSDQQSPFWVTNGTASWIVTNRQLKSESLRYYSHDNKIVKVPIIHFAPTQKQQISVIRVREGSFLKECSYCCRTFPTWAYSVCWCCKEEEQEEKVIRYCDERCQKASRKLHKIRKPDCRKMS